MFANIFISKHTAAENVTVLGGVGFGKRLPKRPCVSGYPRKFAAKRQSDSFISRAM
jgi:hypothetical protein